MGGVVAHFSVGAKSQPFIVTVSFVLAESAPPPDVFALSGRSWRASQRSCCGTTNRIWPDGIWESLLARVILAPMGMSATTPQRRRARSGREGPPGLLANESGFTLPELMIVIVLMGIVLAIASASWFGVVESRAVDAATNQLASDLRLAHTRATNQLVDWAVVSDPASAGAGAVAPAGNDYYLVRIRPTIAAEDVIGRDLGEDNRAQIATSTPIALRFKPDGSVRATDDTVLSAPVTITVHAEGGTANDPNSHDVQIVPATSRVQVDP